MPVCYEKLLPKQKARYGCNIPGRAFGCQNKNKSFMTASAEAVQVPDQGRDELFIHPNTANVCKIGSIVTGRPSVGAGI